MGTATYLHLRTCPHDTVFCDGDSLAERSARTPTCVRCGADVDWSTIDRLYDLTSRS